MTEFSIEEQILCVRREIKMRENIYPKWVAKGNLTSESADKEVNTMRAVLATLERLYREKSSMPLFANEEPPP